MIGHVLTIAVSSTSSTVCAGLPGNPVEFVKNALTRAEKTAYPWMISPKGHDPCQRQNADTHEVIQHLGTFAND